MFGIGILKQRRVKERLCPDYIGTSLRSLYHARRSHCLVHLRFIRGLRQIIPSPYKLPSIVRTVHLYVLDHRYTQFAAMIASSNVTCFNYVCVGDPDVATNADIALASSLRKQVRSN